MASLRDLNKQRRDFAFSGKADIGDVPYLYALQEARAGANQPAGIGEGQGSPEATGAPNPQAGAGLTGSAGGGGATGAADIGISGPGMTGLGEGFDQALRDFEASGAGAGEPGALDRGFLDPNENYFDLSGDFGTGLNVLRALPGVPGLFGSAINAGIRGGNMALLNRRMEEAGFPGGLDFWDQALAVTGFNNYGEGSITADQGARRDYMQEVVEGDRSFGPQGPVDPASAGLIDRAVADYDFNESRGGGQSGESGFGGPGGDRPGGGGGFGDIGGGGGGAGGASGSASIFHEGGYLDESMNPGEYRGDVPATLQEGEAVLTADAMDILGPGFVEGVNMMAKMQRGRGY